MRGRLLQRGLAFLALCLAASVAGCFFVEVDSQEYRAVIILNEEGMLNWGSSLTREFFVDAGAEAIAYSVDLNMWVGVGVMARDPSPVFEGRFTVTAPGSNESFHFVATSQQSAHQALVERPESGRYVLTIELEPTETGAWPTYHGSSAHWWSKIEATYPREG